MPKTRITETKSPKTVQTWSSSESTQASYTKGMRSMKSMRSVRSLHSILDFSEDEPDREQNSVELEVGLPRICAKFSCPYDVVVKKIVLSKAAESHSRLPRTDKSPADTPRPSIQKFNIVVVRGYYDTMNRLTEIELKNIRDVPRILMQSIGLLVPYHNQLIKFTITDCRINGYTIHELGKMIPLSSITEITLDGCPLREGIYAALLDQSHIIRLSLRRCRLNDEVCMQIASKLSLFGPSAKSLLALYLSSNEITDVGAEYLAAALRTNRTLRYLNLSDNKLTDAGAICIFDLLKQFQLTEKEVLEKRKRYLNYIRNRMEDAKRNLIATRSDFQIARTKRGTSKLTHQRKLQAKSSMLQKHDHKEGVEDDSFNDPYNDHNVEVRDGLTFCRGNFVLCYVNVSYNDLSYLCLHSLERAVSYQGSVLKSPEVGLVRVVVEGNRLPECCDEYHPIQAALVRNAARLAEGARVHRRPSTTRSTRSQH